MRSLLRGACLSATTAAFVILGPTGAPEEREAQALPKFDPPGIEGGGLGVDCGTLPVSGEIVGMMRLVGYPIIGFTVELDARSVKQRWGRGCGGDFVGPAEQFTWAIESQPVGSGATLVDD